jgi:hypothetical protein
MLDSLAEKQHELPISPKFPILQPECDSLSLGGVS